jgi:hypothetical protein
MANRITAYNYEKKHSFILTESFFKVRGKESGEHLLKLP